MLHEIVVQVVRLCIVSIICAALLHFHFTKLVKSKISWQKVPRNAYSRFITCRLDQCSSLLYALPESQNANSKHYSVTRLVSLSRKYDRITPILRKLHWFQLSIVSYIKYWFSYINVFMVWDKITVKNFSRYINLLESPFFHATSSYYFYHINKIWSAIFLCSCIWIVEWLTFTR